MNLVLESYAKYMVFLYADRNIENAIKNGQKGDVLRALTTKYTAFSIKLANNEKKIWKIKVVEEAFLHQIYHSAPTITMYLLQCEMLPLFIKLLGLLKSKQIVSKLEDILWLALMKHSFNAIFIMVSNRLQFAGIFSQLNTIIDLLIECKLAAFLESGQNIYKDLTTKIKATAITITETATESTATLGIESAAQALGQAAAGVLITVAIDVALTTRIVYKAKKEKDKGLITGKQFQTKVKKKLFESGFQFVGGTTGSVVGQLLIPVPGLGAFVGGLCGSLIGTGIGKGINYGLFDRHVAEKEFKDESRNFKLILQIFEKIKLRNPEHICVYNEELQLFKEITVIEIAKKYAKSCAQEYSSRTPSPIRDLFTRRRNMESAQGNNRQLTVDRRNSSQTDTRQTVRLSVDKIPHALHDNYNCDEEINSKTSEVINTDSSCNTVDEKDRIEPNSAAKDKFDIFRSYFRSSKNKSTKDYKSLDENASETRMSRSGGKREDLQPVYCSEKSASNYPHNQKQLSTLPEYFDQAKSAMMESALAGDEMDRVNEATTMKHDEIDVTANLDQKEEDALKDDRAGFPSKVTKRIASSWRQKSKSSFLNRSVDVSNVNRRQSGLLKRISSLIESINTSKGLIDEKEEDNDNMESFEKVQLEVFDEQPLIESERKDEDKNQNAQIFEDGTKIAEEIHQTYVDRETPSVEESNMNDANPKKEKSEPEDEDFSDSTKRLLFLWRQKTLGKLGLDRKSEAKGFKKGDVFERAFAFFDKKYSDNESDQNTAHEEETFAALKVENVLDSKEADVKNAQRSDDSDTKPSTESTDLSLFEKLQDLIRDTVGSVNNESDCNSTGNPCGTSNEPEKSDSHSILNERFKEMVSLFKKTSSNVDTKNTNKKMGDIAKAKEEDQQQNKEGKPSRESIATLMHEDIPHVDGQQQREDAHEIEVTFDDIGDNSFEIREYNQCNREYDYEYHTGSRFHMHRDSMTYRAGDEDGEVTRIMEHGKNKEYIDPYWHYYEQEPDNRMLQPDMINNGQKPDVNSSQDTLYKRGKMTDVCFIEQSQLRANGNMQPVHYWQRDDAQFTMNMCDQIFGDDNNDGKLERDNEFAHSFANVGQFENSIERFEGSITVHEDSEDNSDQYDNDNEESDDDDLEKGTDEYHEDENDNNQNSEAEENQRKKTPEERHFTDQAQAESIFLKISRNLEKMKESLQK